MRGLLYNYTPPNAFKRVYYRPPFVHQYSHGWDLVSLKVLCYYISACKRRLIGVLWSPAGKGLSSWPLFVMSNCGVVTFPLVSWVR